MIESYRKQKKVRLNSVRHFKKKLKINKQMLDSMHVWLNIVKPFSLSCGLQNVKQMTEVLPMYHFSGALSWDTVCVSYF